MQRCKTAYLELKTERVEVRAEYFRNWKLFWKSEKRLRVRKEGTKNKSSIQSCVTVLYLQQYNLCGKCFLAWAEETSERRNMARLALDLFNKALERNHLSSMTVAAYFNVCYASAMPLFYIIISNTYIAVL